MLENLKKQFNKTITENGDKAFKSTNSKVLDFFSSIGAMRNSTEEEVIRRFVLAYNENESLTMKCLFFTRDIKQGLGERKVFKTIIDYMGDNHPNKIKPYIRLIPEYGRWDDLLILLNTKVEDEAIGVIKNQFLKDLDSEKPSLLAKWLPSVNTSSKNTREHAKYIHEKLGLSAKVYRKNLSTLRSRINVIEKTMSKNEWSSIEYDKIPSKAGMIYRKAFSKHDSDRYVAFLESVKKGEKKINSSTLFPYEIYDKVMKSSLVDNTLEELWKALPNYVEKEQNAMVVADVSGSMIGRPMSVSVSLALYFAERNKGRFANHFMTFSDNPQLVEIQGKTVFEKMKFIKRAEWQGSTDLRKTLLVILNTAVQDNLTQSDMPKTLYIISDMQFNQCTRNADLSTFESVKKEFNNKGYELPEIVFWNVNDHNNKPVTMNEVNVQLVSGCSPTLFKQIVSGLSAYDLMVKILSSERYKDIN